MPDLMPYYDIAPDPAGDDRRFRVTIDALEVAEVSQVTDDNGNQDWLMTRLSLLPIEDVSLGDGPADRIPERAKGWLESYLTNERPDLLEALFDDD